MPKDDHFQHIGKTKGMQNHDHDMVHELSQRIDSLWRYDQYIANAEGNKSLENLWKKLKKQERSNITSLKRMISDHVKKKCF
ncbi:MAG: hypothetical protein ACR2NW_09140 [Thermodesulfobacteriota bacterium]